MILALDTLNVRHISTSALVDLLTKKVSRDAHLAMTVSTKFEVDTTIRQWSYMVGHVFNPSTKFEDPTAICY